MWLHSSLLGLLTLIFTLSLISGPCTQTLLQMKFEPEGTGQVSDVVVRTTCEGLLDELVTTLLPGHLSF